MQRGTECRIIHSLMTKTKSFIPRQKRVSNIVNGEVLEGKHVQKAAKKFIKKNRSKVNKFEDIFSCTRSL